MTKRKPKRNPIVGNVWLGSRFLHLKWRRYDLTICGLPIPDAQEALARGGERKTQGYPICIKCRQGEAWVLCPPNSGESVESPTTLGEPESSVVEPNSISELTPQERFAEAKEKEFRLSERFKQRRAKQHSQEEIYRSLGMDT